METFIILIFIIPIFYVLPSYIAYKKTQKAHYHPQGKYTNIKPSFEDIFYVMFPILNWIIAIQDWKSFYYEKETNFFKPKNPFKK